MIATIRQLGTVPMVDEQESTTDNEEARQAQGLGVRVNSNVVSHIHSPPIDEQSTLRAAEAASQRVKLNDVNLKSGKGEESEARG